MINTFVIATSSGFEPAPRSSTRRGCQVQQLLEETSEAALPIHQVDFQDPVAGPAGAVDAAHRRGAAMGDVVLDLVAVDPLVRELADQMSGVRSAVLPARLGGQAKHLGEQLLTGDVRMCV